MRRVLREAFDYPFSRLDPMGAHIDPPSVAIYETLLVKGHDRQGHPGLARVVDVSQDGLEWTLELRPGARFHSGSACDARAVVASLEAMRWHMPGGRQLWYWDPVADVVPSSESTLHFRLHRPYVRLPSLLWGTHTAVFNRAAQLEHPDDFGYSICDGTGPFMLESFSERHVVARSSPSHPGLVVPGFPVEDGGLDGIEWFFLADPGERLEALRQGDVDCLHGVDFADLPTLQGDPRFAIFEVGQSSNMYLSLNWERGELGFDDIRVRRAISGAIDREGLVRRALLGHGRPTWGPLPPGTEYYDPCIDAAGVYDPARSDRELTELGWVREADGIRAKDGVRMAFECVVQRDSVFEAVGALMTEQLAAVGLEIQIRAAKPFAEFYDACAQGPASSISKWLWQDPIDALIGFASTSTSPFPNWSRASVPALDAVFQKWLAAATGPQLAEAASAIQRTFTETLPYVPLLSPNDLWVWSRQVRGFHPSQDVLYPLYHGVMVELGEDADGDALFE